MLDGDESVLATVDDEYRASHTGDVLEVVIGLFCEKGAQFSDELAHEVLDGGEGADKGQA
jgi:hypothetical protein